MSLIDQINELSNFDYCKVTKLNDCHYYQFGWRYKLHFYLNDYHYNDEYGSQYILVVWLDKKMIFNKDFKEIEP